MKITVRTRDDTRTVDCDPGERILYAALREGLDLPYECATGTCGTCKARTRPGCVEELWPMAPGKSYLKAERGEFLMCQARALSDCEILVPGRPAAGPARNIQPAHRRGRISSLHRLTHDVVSVEVDLNGPANFHAGQFMVVQTPDVSGFRAYSMSNFDINTQKIRFVVKKKPGGGFSEWLFAPDALGAELNLFGPLGRATFDPRENKDFLGIAGGSGIAGMMSMLQHAFQNGYFEEHRGSIFFGVRTMQDTFYLDQFSEFRAMAPKHLNVTIALSDESAPDPQSTDFPDLSYASGFVHQVAAEHVAGGLARPTTAFVAGPPPMVDGALRVLILEARLPADDIRYDKFS